MATLGIIGLVIAFIVLLAEFLTLVAWVAETFFCSGKKRY